MLKKNDDGSYELPQFTISHKIPFSLKPKKDVVLDDSIPLSLKISGESKTGNVELTFSFSDYYVESEDVKCIAQFYELKSEFLKISSESISQAECIAGANAIKAKITDINPPESSIVFDMFTDLLRDVNTLIVNISGHYYSSLNSDDFIKALGVCNMNARKITTTYSSSSAAAKCTRQVTEQLSTYSSLSPPLPVDSTHSYDLCSVTPAGCSSPISQQMVTGLPSPIPFGGGVFSSLANTFTNNQQPTLKYCVKCDTEQPNVKYEKCGHVCVCSECIKTKKIMRCEQCAADVDMFHVI